MNELPSTQAVDWESRYQNGTTGWELPGLHLAFLTWREQGVLRPCRILIPGAGRSSEPLAFAEAGFDVTVVDTAPSAVEVQQTRLAAFATAQAVQADVSNWEPEALFDAIYDQTCFCALPPAIWPDYVARLRRWLKPGGRLFILFMQAAPEGGPPFHCDIENMRRLFGEREWIWPETLAAPIARPSGGPARAEIPVILQVR